MYILAFVVIVAFGIYLFYVAYLPFGGVSSKKQWLASRNFNQKIFINQIPTSMTFDLSNLVSFIHRQLSSRGARQPNTPIHAEPVDFVKFLNAETPQFIWLGHSSVLIRIHGKTILTDPILSQRSSPFTFIGPKRVISELPVTVEKLPPIDAILISHDHYDHLDYATIRKLRAKTTKFFVPLGVASHLRKWGVESNRIEELDWWESSIFDGFTFTCAPARHFSGRKLGDRFQTLWCSWVIDTSNCKIYLSGDSGYGPHFKQIGTKYGPFDLTLMECGQYDTLWPDIHMMPEDTVRAHQDLRGRLLFPIHWGAFVLALHPWADSVIRAESAAKKAGVTLLSSKIGEMSAVKSIVTTVPPWWDDKSIS